MTPRSAGCISSRAPTCSNRVANRLHAQGVACGDRIILMLGNPADLWETILAAMKLGAVVIPATTLLTPVDLRDTIAATPEGELTL